MTKRRRMEITVESSWSVLRRPAAHPSGSASALICCPQCSLQVPLLSPDEAAMLAGVSTRTIYRWVEAGQLHYIESVEGKLLVCPNSLPLSIEKEKVL